MERRLLWLGSIGMVIACALALWLWLTSHAMSNALECHRDLKLQNHSCVISYEDTPVAHFSIAVTNDKALQPLVIHLQPLPQAPLDIEHATVELTGINEYMGINIYPLKAQTSKGLSYAGVLPVCTVAAMQWHAQINLATSQGQAHSQMQFITHREL